MILVALGANPNNEKAMIRAKSLASLLMGKGDTGQSAMLAALGRHVDSTTGAGALAGYVSYNDKWMGNIKSGDIGGYKFINDLASGDAIKARSDYNIMGSDKFTQSTIGAAGDSWYDGMKAALADGTFNANTTNRKILQDYDDIATKALTNPRNSIKGERLDTLNEIRQAAYLARQSDWLAANAGKTAADYESEFGAFQDLRANDELRIAHKKATMPAGWRRATAAEATMYGHSGGFKEGDWIQGTGTSTAHLNATDVNRANAIERQNIDADIQNSQ